MNHSFALVTGASKGIGRAIALQLAHRGKQLLLVARNEQELRNVQEDILISYGIKSHYFVADLSQKDATKKIYDWCMANDFRINVLVNNAGFGLSGSFEKFSLEEHESMMQVNMNAVVELTYLFLPVLKSQPRSYILNICSSASYQATPYLTLYAASKAFIRLFTRGLRVELKKTSVSVTCVSPGATDTAFNDRAQIGDKARKMAKRLSMTPKEVAAIAVSAMYNHRSELIVGAVNKFGAFLSWALPKKFVENTVSRIYQ
ncbi:MAG: SDR family NAD(P)-dependent oxidoreductase [Flavisolibacter sp.]